jgi:hypothetical protein
MDVKLKIKMKKLFTLSFALFMLAGIVSSCSKDDDELVGTTWIAQLGDGDNATIAFISGSTVSLTAQFYYYENGRREYERESNTGTYTYNKPNIVMAINGSSITGTVKGSTMILTSEGETLIFTKQ